MKSRRVLGPSTRILGLVLGLQATGCRPYTAKCERWEYDELMSVCGYNPDDPMSGYLMGRDGYAVGSDCIDAVGQHYCVDWKSFGEEPQAFVEPQTYGEHIVANLLSIVGTTAGPARTEQFEYAPESLQALVSDLPTEVGFGQVMFSFTTAAIDTIRYGPGMDAMGLYNNGLVRLGDLGIGDVHPNVIVADEYPPWPLVGLVLVHEAAHDLYPGHQGCDLGVDCDPDIEGAYGLSAWWATSWLTATHKLVSYRTCQTLRIDAYEYGCMRIGDFGDWPVCDLNFVECQPDG